MTLLAALVLWPAIAGSQSANPSSELKYCQALSDIYLRYIGYDETYGERIYAARTNLDARVALTKCRQGDAAAAIPVLERELTNNHFSLPPRG